MDLLPRGNPQALIILAHYCVLLERAETSWFLQRQAQALLESFENRLDERWAVWLEWPKRQIGMSEDP